MVKKHKFKKNGRGKTDQAREELKILEDLPLVGGLFKGLEKFIDLAEEVEKAGGEIKRRGEIKGLKGETKGVYGFSVKTGIGGRPQVQTFGNIQPIKKKAGKRDLPAGKAGIKIIKTREPIVDIFDERDHILIIAELPGIAKESIKLNLLKEDILTLEAGDEERKYSKEILLPAKVNFTKKKLSFKNGILKIKIPKKK